MSKRFARQDVNKSSVGTGFDSIVKDAERFDLSGADILRLTDHKTHVLPYEALEKVSSLSEILRRYGSVILLYQTAEQFGHWVTLIDRGNNHLEFYDPYGLNVDEELNLSNEFHLRKHNGLITPHLTALIHKDGWSVEYNKDRLQKMLDDVNTCGRYCALRIIFIETPMNKFNSLLKNNKFYNPDMWVSALTLLC